jgi:nitrogen-specific signal transduction histidine kinase
MSASARIATGWWPRFNSRTTARVCSRDSRHHFYPLVSGRADGTGLGLGIAQDLVSRHGGLIEFDSAPGRTIFVISLPMDSI